MNLENTGLSRRKLLRTAAIGVPAAGAVAMGATLITAPASNAAMIAADGYWGTETTRMLQTLFKLDVVDGIVSSQPASRASANPGLAGGWDWVSDASANGSQTIRALQGMLRFRNYQGSSAHAQSDPGRAHRAGHYFRASGTLQAHPGWSAER